VTPVVADASRWVLVVFLALASAEKAADLFHGAAGWHPVMLVAPWRRRWASLLMGVSLLADAFAVLCLIIAPRLGAALACVLIVTYTSAAIRVHLDGEGTDCRCFFKVPGTRTRVGLVVRNSWLLFLAVAVLLWRPDASWTGLGLGLAVFSITVFSPLLSRRLNWSRDEASRISDRLAAERTDRAPQLSPTNGRNVRPPDDQEHLSGSRTRAAG
jgi:hypothetical protein